MDVIEEARAFMVKAKDMCREGLREAVKLLPKAVQDAYWEMDKASYFVPENEVPDSRKEILSPSGKYKLVVSRFGTSPGSWNYSQGIVYRKGDDKPIATVQRNYGAFPNLFIEGHPKGDFLVCGKDYQGQTVIELDTDKRRDLMSDGSDKGFGFCWAQYQYDAASGILVVCGCFWACPYAFKFFEFSDPMSGWPELACFDAEGPDGVYDDEKWPEILSDGTVRCFETRRPESEEEDEAKPKPEPELRSVKTFRRDGLRLLLDNEWVSEAEQESRRQQAESERKYEEWKEKFKATDPLYLAYVALLKDSALSPDSYESVGSTHKDWCPDFQETERRWCRRIVTHKGKTGPTVDLEWAVETGPIKLVLYRDGKQREPKFFEHSTAGMNEAFAYAKGIAAEIDP